MHGSMVMKPVVRHFYDEASGTLTYVVSAGESGKAAIIDPVLGFSVASGRTDTQQADSVIDYLREHALAVEWILETHAHADHLSAAQYLKTKVGGKVAIGEGICGVQEHFGKIFNLGESFAADGNQFDHLFCDGEVFSVGEMSGQVMHTPGHTNDSVSYRFGDCVFIGDSLFMTDFGTARCDFPGGDAGLLYDSIQKLLSLPDTTRLFMCHDYPPEGRSLRYEISVAEQKAENKHVAGTSSRDEFVAMREERDATLSLPALILPSIQVNIRAGNLPHADDNDIRYIRIPLDTL